MRSIRQIVIHGALTFPDMDTDAAEIRRWHLAKGWNDIGYHFVIKRNGVVEKGRPVEIQGAHSRPVNATSIGIVLVGGRKRGTRNAEWEFNYTAAQMSSLKRLVNQLRAEYPGAVIGGHNSFERRKCPGFNVEAWASTLKSEVS